MNLNNSHLKLKRLAIIPARSGSTRLKDKNIMKIKNHPMIAYTIHAALESNLFDKVHVSTDSETYADIAYSYGAAVDFLRPKRLSESKSTSLSVIRYTIEKYQSLGDEYDQVCLLQPTSPLRNSSHIKDAFELFYKTKSKTVVSVSRDRKKSLALIAKRENHGLRVVGTSEDLINESCEIHYPNGAIYIFDAEFILNNSKYYSSETYLYEMGFIESVDIDSPDDHKELLSHFGQMLDIPNPEKIDHGETK